MDEQESQSGYKLLNKRQVDKDIETKKYALTWMDALFVGHGCTEQRKHGKEMSNMQISRGAGVKCYLPLG